MYSIEVIKYQEICSSKQIYIHSEKANNFQRQGLYSCKLLLAHRSSNKNLIFCILWLYLWFDQMNKQIAYELYNINQFDIMNTYGEWKTKPFNLVRFGLDIYVFIFMIVECRATNIVRINSPIWCRNSYVYMYYILFSKVKIVEIIEEKRHCWNHLKNFLTS